MDAPKLNPDLKPACSKARPRYVRLAIVWLAAVLALGLWEGYGAWLFSEGPGHDF